MIKSKKLLIHKEISHGFFNRSGGKSTGIYRSLNCGLGSNDKVSNVKKNLKIVKNKIGKDIKNIFLLHQIHSNKFVFINKNYNFIKKKIKADAIITNQKKIPIAILTADCVPILLYESKKNMIAAIHAGWKGAFKGIIKKVINFMIKKTIHFFICLLFTSIVFSQEKTIELPLIGDRLSGAVSETEEQALGRQFLRDLKKDAKILYDPIVQEWTELFIYKIGS